ELTNTSNDPMLVASIIEAAKSSMGSDISAIDILNIRTFAKRVANLYQFRSSLHQYLCSRMESCAPNLTALIGEQVGARLISKAGSLVKLAKYPASTLQILGAEKALFRALKSRGKCNTPKYGLIFNSSFITRALAKNKGRISRYLANKAAMACRLDCFLDNPTNKYGLAFKEQVEQRLQFFKTGKLPETNSSIMGKVRKGIDEDEDEDEDMQDLDSKQAKPVKTKTGKDQFRLFFFFFVFSQKRSREEDEEEDEEEEEEEKTTAPPTKKRKVTSESVKPAAKPKKPPMDEDVSSGSQSDDEAEEPKQTKPKQAAKNEKHKKESSEEEEEDEESEEEDDNEEKLRKEMEEKLRKEMEEKLKLEMQKLTGKKKETKKKKKQ
ncbi:hypothetical protein RFI_11508, partial [Reticulomyxa filosa]